MASPYRTHSCGAIRPADNGSTVTLSGWVNNYRDHGGVRFVDLRDREGLTQVVFHPNEDRSAAAAHETAQKLRHEDVIRVTGEVVKREGGVNPKLATGEVEVDAAELTILNKSQTPPFTPRRRREGGRGDPPPPPLPGHATPADAGDPAEAAPGHQDRPRLLRQARLPGDRDALPCAAPPRKVRGTFWSPAACRPAASTPCPRARSCSSSS